MQHLRRSYGALCSVIALMFFAHSALASSIMLIDSQAAERQSRVIARLKAEALALQKARGVKSETLNPQFAEALDLSISDWRSALPEVVASIAKQAKADIALEPAIAKAEKLTGVDRTAEVVKALDARFAKLALIAP
jgi:hypothetical protein